MVDSLLRPFAMRFFENIFVINLKKRKERWRKTMQRLSLCGFDPGTVRRVEAVDGKELFRNDPSRLKSVLADRAYAEIQHRTRSYHEQLTLGAVGCALSHISVWREVVKKQIPEALVFEDDIVPSRNFKVLLSERWPEIPRDRDLVFLGCWHRKSPAAVNKHVVRPVKIFRTHAYVISRQGAAILMNEVFPLKVQLDAYLSGMFPLLHVYAFRPRLVRQGFLKWFDTDVQVPIRRFYDPRSFFVKMKTKG